MEEKLLSLLGLARRAGRVSLGFDAACDSVKNGSAVLVIAASDLSERTKRGLASAADGTRTEIIFSDIPMDRLGAAVGKPVGIISVNDAGFAGKMKTLCN